MINQFFLVIFFKKKHINKEKDLQKSAKKKNYCNELNNTFAHQHSLQHQSDV